MGSRNEQAFVDALGVSVQGDERTVNLLVSALVTLPVARDHVPSPTKRTTLACR
jgi:hypothetical protein